MRPNPAILLLAACVVLAPPAVAQQGGRIEVVFPLDMIVVDDPDLPVEGRVTSPAVDEVSISVEDGRESAAAVRDTFFVGEAELEDGRNVVRVGEHTFSVWLATEETPAPAGYRRVYGHVGLGDGCAECHEIDRDGAFALAADRDELCDWCHGELVRGRRGEAWGSVHDPVKRGACLQCHVPHLTTSPGLPREDAPACGACHKEVLDRLGTDRYVHGPMSLGDCRLCHVVHASEQDALLVRPATSLCTDCHSDALPPADTPPELRPHPMIPEGKCGVCHEPHSSLNPKMLRQPAARLCLGCHEGKTRSFHEAKGFSIYVCAKCHDLHRPDREHLLADTSRSLCLQCHDYGGEAAFTHSFVSDGECFRCHAFHEAPLGRDVALTCLGCHRDNPRLPRAHGGVPFARSRCTICHLPHQARRRMLLRDEEHPPFAERECAACHTERAALLGDSWRALCVSCHADKDLAALAAPPAVVHPPLREGDCADCHESHDADVPGLLRRPEAQLCLECHRKLRKSFLVAPASAHDSFLEGRCGACHDPHLSENENLLRSPQGALCAGCHAALVAGPDGAPWARPHPPVADGKCRLCHRPHTAGDPSLLKAPLPQPCRPCHAEFFQGLERGPGGGAHTPVREGRCEACHAIHGGGRAGLLRGAPGGELCTGCHDALQGGHHLYEAADLEAREGGSGAGERGCLHCHEPHASDGSRLLLPRSGPPCAGCHRT